jgi:hypothetical protein
MDITTTCSLRHTVLIGFFFNLLGLLYTPSGARKLRTASTTLLSVVKLLHVGNSIYFQPFELASMDNGTVLGYFFTGNVQLVEAMIALNTMFHH